MTIITIDIETYYDAKCSLKKLTVPEYVAHPDFRVHMASIKIEDNPAVLIHSNKLQETLDWTRSNYPEITTVSHNAQFDAYVLHEVYGFKPDKYIDTMAMCRADNPHASASLKNSCIRLFPTRLDLRKGDELSSSKGIKNITEGSELFNSLGGYCIKDTELCWHIFNKLKSIIPPQEMEIIDLLVQMNVEPIAKLDVDLLKRYLNLLQVTREKIIKSSGTTEKVLGSNPQFKEFIEKTLRLKCPEKVSPATGLPAPALAQGDLGYQKLVKDNPQFNNVWEARKNAKSNLLGSRTERLINVANATGGYLPVALTYSAAHTHRLGGAGGLNLQNLPRNAPPDHPDGDLRPGALRRAIIAPEGKVILVRDLSNIEARLLAYTAGQTDLVESFRQGKDTYAAMASRIYGQEINKKDNPFERNVGKVAILGLGYQMSGNKFKDTLNAGPLGMPPIFLDDEAMYDHIVYGVYRKVNYAIVNFWEQCERFIYWMATAEAGDNLVYKMLKVTRGQIELPGGLKLQYPELKRGGYGWQYRSKTGIKNIYGGSLAENIMQALAQIVIKSNMLSIRHAFPDKDLRIILQVHDEVISIVDESKVEEYDKEIAKIMATPPEWAPDLPLDSEGGWAKNYSK